MLIKIDTKKRKIEVPKKIYDTLERRKKENEETGAKEVSLFSEYDIMNYEVVKSTGAKGRTVGDKTTKKQLVEYMEGKKDSNPEVYSKFIALKDKVVSVNEKTGFKRTTDLFTLKAFVKKNFPTYPEA